MAKLFKPSDLNKRGQFGLVKTVANSAGGFTKTFVASFSRWYGIRNRTMNQTYQIYSTSLQDTIDIFIRHDQNVQKQFLFKSQDGQQYTIETISPNESSNPNAFDILTLKETARKGATNG